MSNTMATATMRCSTCEAGCRVEGVNDEGGGWSAACKRVVQKPTEHKCDHIQHECDHESYMVYVTYV